MNNKKSHPERFVWVMAADYCGAQPDAAFSTQDKALAVLKKFPQGQYVVSKLPLDVAMEKFAPDAYDNSLPFCSDEWRADE